MAHPLLDSEPPTRQDLIAAWMGHETSVCDDEVGKNEKARRVSAGFLVSPDDFGIATVDAAMSSDPVVDLWKVRCARHHRPARRCRNARRHRIQGASTRGPGLPPAAAGHERTQGYRRGGAVLRLVGRNACDQPDTRGGRRVVDHVTAKGCRWRQVRRRISPA
jgi:hypothetical protein